MPSNIIRLHADQFYHIYNRGNHKCTIFHAEKDYRDFLKLYAYHIQPVAKTYAYCLMNNHFHICLQIRSPNECQNESWHSYTGEWVDYVSGQFRNFFGSYTLGFNKRNKWTGSLFEKPFKRKRVANEYYLTNLIHYIHHNPQKHRFVDNFREWKWSSWHGFIHDKSTRLPRKDVFDIFGGQDSFIHSHQTTPNEKVLYALIDDDFD